LRIQIGCTDNCYLAGVGDIRDGQRSSRRASVQAKAKSDGLDVVINVIIGDVVIRDDVDEADLQRIILAKL